MGKKINFRQLSIMIFYLLVSLKFLALPSLIYLECETDSWIVFLFMAIIDVVLVVVIIYLMKASNEKSFYEFLKHRFGVVLSKIICVSYLAIYIFDILDGITGIQRLLLENFYSELSWFVFLIPLLTIMAFMVYKGIRNIGRVCEIFVWLVILGLLFIVAKSLSQFDPTFFLPFLSKGAIPIIKSLFRHTSWYGTPVALLFLLGNVDFKNYKKTVAIKYIVIAVLEILTLVSAFYGVFKHTSGIHSFALSDLSQISNSATALDELSWLVVSIWVIAQILQLSVLFFASVTAFRNIFHIKNSWLPILIINLGIIIYQNVNNQTIDLEKFFYKTPIVICEVSVKFGLTLLIVVVNIIYLKLQRRKKHGKT